MSLARMLLLSMVAGLLSCDESGSPNAEASAQQLAAEVGAPAEVEPLAPADAAGFLKMAIASLEKAALNEDRRTSQRVELVIDLIRHGEVMEADTQIQALDERVRTMTLDMLFVYLTRNDPLLKTSWSLAYIDANANDAQRVTRLLILAGGLRQHDAEPAAPNLHGSYFEAARDNKFAAQALSLLEARGGFDDLPEDEAAVHSDWVDPNRARSDGGPSGVRAGWDFYPGRVVILQSMARAHMLQGDFERALAYLDRIEHSPSLIVAVLQEIAVAQHWQGNRKEALATLRRAERLAEPLRSQAWGRVIQQQAEYGDIASASRAYAARGTAMLDHAIEDPGQVEGLLNAVSRVCDMLRELGAHDQANALLLRAIERFQELPADSRGRFTWPMREASVALLMGDPAMAGRIIDLMAPSPRQVEMRSSVVVGWLHAGDASGARDAFDTLIAEATVTPCGGAGWQYSVAHLREKFEPWVVMLEGGESLPVSYNADERYRQVVTLCRARRFDDAVTFVEQHSPLDSSTLKHLTAIARFALEANQDDAARSVLAKAHALAADGTLTGWDEPREPGGVPRFYFLDNGASRYQPSDLPQAQVFRPRRLAFPILGSPDRSRAQENWAVSGMANLYLLQLQWGLADDAAQLLQESNQPWLSSLAALFAIDWNRSFQSSEGQVSRPGLADSAQVNRFAQDLLRFSESLEDQHRAHLRLGLGAIPTEHPDIAQRVIALMPDLPHQHDSQRSTNLDRFDQLAFAAEGRRVQTIYVACQRAYIHGVLEQHDQLRQTLADTSPQIEQIQHTANQAAMFRLIGGIALVFGQDDLANAYLDRAIALFAVHGGAWEGPAQTRGGPEMSQMILARVANDLAQWRVMLKLDESARMQLQVALRHLKPASGVLARAQYLAGARDDAHATLDRALRDASARPPSGSRSETERRVELIKIYLEAGEAVLAWDVVIANNQPWLSRELLPHIVAAYARQTPEDLMMRIQELESPLLRTQLYRAAARALVEETRD